ncbi:MAG: hypothetical protein V7695_23875 [Sulfitobacter sp.]
MSSIPKNQRTAAVRIELDIPNTEGSPELFQRGNGLFAVTSNMILKIQDPDVVDPERLNADAPWTQSILLPHGKTDPFVARTILQSRQMADIFLTAGSEEHRHFMDVSWEVLNSLVSIRMIRSRLELQIDEIATKINVDRDQYVDGMSPKPLPILNYYDIEFRSFVNEVRRVLTSISKLFKVLHNHEIPSGHFHKALIWVGEKHGQDCLLYQMLENDLNWIKVWIDIRIAIEHPKPNSFVETLNFTLEPNRDIRLPTWRFVHPDYDMARPQNLLDVFGICIENILKFFEDLQVAMLDGKLPASSKVCIFYVDERERELACPKRMILNRI